MNWPPGVIRQEPLARHSTLKLGGRATYFAEPSSEAELIRLASFAHSNRVPLVVVGHGTNVLFDDSGYAGLVLKIGPRMSSIQINGDVIDVQAGAWVPGVARKAQTCGLSGLEHIVGIPGTLGGLIVMNGGSRREAIEESIESVRVMSADGTIEIYDREQCAFGYRKSAFQENGLIVVSAKLVCSKSSSRQVRTEMRQILRSRRQRFPRKLANCGSVFKSDPSVFHEFGSPGSMIEKLGLKGHRIGGACISDMHANFFLNVGSATSGDYLALIDFVQEKVAEAFGVTLQLEVIVQRDNGMLV